MDNNKSLYLEIMTLASTYGAGYSVAQEDWLKVACYTLLAAEFIVRLKKGRTLETEL